jgi:hypothetical protein
MITVVELDEELATFRGNGKWGIEATMLNSEIIEAAKRRSSKETELWMVSLSL